MRDDILGLVVCPTCKSRLIVSETRVRKGAHLLDGALACTGCRTTYSVRAGVPRLVAGTAVESATIEAFGYEWNRFTDVNDAASEREQFLDWVEPLQPDDFVGKVVLDAGCGMGRWAVVAASLGAAAVVAVDRSDAVRAAFARVSDLPNVHVIQGDILSLPFDHARSPIDLVYSIGVLHHMPDPAQGFESIVRATRPGGTVQAWVYGAEGNAWIERFVSPVRRRVTSRMPHRLLDVVSSGVSVPLHAVSRFVARSGGAHRVPYGAYLEWLGRYPYRHTHHIVFDHLAPEIAFYLSRGEIDAWIERTGLEKAQVTSRNKNSWRISATRPAR